MLNPAKVGANLACLANHSLWQAIDRIHALGFASVELLGVAGSRHSVGLLPGLWLDELSAAELERLRRRVAPFAHVSVHAPFVDAPLFTYNRRIAQESLRQVKGCIVAAGRLGARAVAVHANARPFMAVRDYWDDLLGVFRELGDVAAASRVVVGIETGYPNRYDEFLDLVRQVAHPAVGATLDVGHVAFLEESGPRGTVEGARNYNRNLRSLCAALGEQLVHVHLHDVRGADWRDHRALGTGILDLPALLASLRRVDYEGLLQLELEEPEQEAALMESKHLLDGLLDVSR